LRERVIHAGLDEVGCGGKEAEEEAVYEYLSFAGRGSGLP